MKWNPMEAWLALTSAIAGMTAFGAPDAANFIAIGAAIGWVGGFLVFRVVR